MKVWIVLPASAEDELFVPLKVFKDKEKAERYCQASLLVSPGKTISCIERELL